MLFILTLQMSLILGITSPGPMCRNQYKYRKPSGIPDIELRRISGMTQHMNGLSAGAPLPVQGIDGLGKSETQGIP